MRRAAAVVALLAAALAGGAGTAAPAAASYAYGALAERPTVALSKLQGPGYSGGPITAADGETVTVYAMQELLAADPGIQQRFADLLASLVHGSELGSLSLYLATVDRVQQVCGRGALGCYEDDVIVAMGQDYQGIAASSIVTHEYGHHVANNRLNDPWRAVDWGTKRWASYENVCKRQQAGQLFPGDEGLHYELNPGEDFAENYRVLNERRAGLPEAPWGVVDPSLYPDQTALDLLAEDVTTPWTGNTTTTVTGQIGPRATGRGFRIQTPLDGDFAAALQAPPASRFTLRLVDLATGTQLAYSSTAGARKSVSFQLCGQRSVQIQIKRVRGSGPFALSISKP